MTDSDANKGASLGNAGLRTREALNQVSAEPRNPKMVRGWYSRGYLPHFDSNDVTQHVAFHLADSLPEEALHRLALELNDRDPQRREFERRRLLEALIDAGHGACWLRRPDCARTIQESLLHFDGERYRLLAWVVMPNHVHALFQTMNGWSMGSVVGSWKTFTANAVGRLVAQRGGPLPKVWHPEFWDRYIRDERHFANAMTYIHNNPVKAGLIAKAEEWPWSSANPRNGKSSTCQSFDNASAEPRDPRGDHP